MRGIRPLAAVAVASLGLGLLIAHATGAANPDGRYKGSNAELRIKNDGRQLNRLKVDLTAFCKSDDIVPVTGRVRRARILGSGRFRGVERSKGQRNRFSGRLQGRRVTGKITVKFDDCVGKLEFQARKRR